MTGDALRALAVRVEQATGPDHSLDGEIAFAVGWRCRTPYRRKIEWKAPGSSWGSWLSGPPAFTASLDAALTLVPEGACWQISGPQGGWGATLTDVYAGAEVVAASCHGPALALCAAALRARAALADQAGEAGS